MPEIDTEARKVPYRYVGDDYWLFIAEVEEYMKEPPIRSTRYVIAYDFTEAVTLLDHSLEDGLCINKLERVFVGGGAMVFPVRDFMYDSTEFPLKSDQRLI